ncbi:hypothetical protein QF046_001192 [Microbacterium sp. W4I4]|uniref:hypothetical protein n=1 Tax=Microbacterium sp. W4I4 TaxID=3042295 RepID=UPI002780ABA3|nr:hypothetical protein [Microbacterium sp. W4I4]MDQ0613551.1 hypothetical protein [Microbacterium sp. W4I4]
MRARAVAAITAVLLALPLAACSPNAAAPPDLPKQDITKWTMPLDEYWTAATDELANYASSLMIAACLKHEGIEWPIPWQSTDEASYLQPPANNSSFPALTVSLAQTDGYRTKFAPGGFGAPTAEWVQARQKLNAIVASTPGFDPLFDACLKKARKQVDESDAVQISNTVLGWSNESLEAANRAPKPKQSSTDWRECMHDAGLPVDQASPVGSDGWMPEQQLLTRLGIPPRWQTGDGAPENPLTQGEIDLAVADATCRESSGWTAAIYTAMWDAQVKIVAERGDELVRLRHQGDALRQVALKIIAEHAPEK